MTKKFVTGRLIFPLSAISGYIIGIFIAAATESATFVSTMPLSRELISMLSRLIARQLLPMFLIWLCGYIRTRLPLCAPILLIRALLVGRSAAYLYASTLPRAAYFLSTALSGVSLLLLISLCNASEDYKTILNKSAKMQTDIEKDYFFTFLLLSGLSALLCVLCQFGSVLLT